MSPATCHEADMRHAALVSRMTTSTPGEDDDDDNDGGGYPGRDAASTAAALSVR
jgi:hypothetical protein